MSLTEYTDKKSQYYEILNNKFRKKRFIRSYVGLRTLLNEWRHHNLGEDKYAAHINAFIDAVDETKKFNLSNDLEPILLKLLKEFRSRSFYFSRESGGKTLLPAPIPKMKEWKGNGLTLISLYSGALGLDLGFLAAGFALRLACDINPNSFKTVTRNIPKAPFINRNVTNIKKEEFFLSSGLKRGELDVLTGGPPCQPFSTAGKRMGFNDPRASPLSAFVNAIKTIQPKVFVMEEVMGLKSSRLQHIPISERKGQKLNPEQKKGSAFKIVLEMLNSTGYEFVYDVLNSADYGSPQSRKRLIIIGCRDGKPSLPEPTHSREIEEIRKGKAPWNSLWESIIDIQGQSKEFTSFSKSRKYYLEFIGPGGNWKQLPNKHKKDAMGGAYNSGGGKVGYYRRLTWDEPSPTVVGNPIHKGTMLCHPEQTRPLSIEEYKRVQGFPDDWEICGSNLSTKYQLIGDAVPVHLSYAIGRHVAKLLIGKP